MPTTLTANQVTFLFEKLYTKQLLLIRVVYAVYIKINNKLPRKKLSAARCVTLKSNFKLYEFDFGVFPQTCYLNL